MLAHHAHCVRASAVELEGRETVDRLFVCDELDEDGIVGIGCDRLESLKLLQELRESAAPAFQEHGPRLLAYGVGEQRGLSRGVLLGSGVDAGGVDERRNREAV